MPSGFKLGNIKVRTSTNLDKIFLNKIRTIVEESRPKALDSRFKEAVESTITEFVKKNRIYRLLQSPPIGTIGADLPAEFGLEPAVLQDALIKLVLILSKAYEHQIRVEPKRTLGAADITLFSMRFLTPDLYEELYADEEPFAYTSQRTLVHPNRKNKKDFNSNPKRIRWMLWLLNADRGISTIKETVGDINTFGIHYGVSPVSRSGRAVMRPLGERSKVDPYEFPNAARALPTGKNFVQDIAQNPNFRVKMETRINSVVKQTLTPRFR